MPEEVENLEDENDVNGLENSSSSSPRNTDSKNGKTNKDKSENNIIDFNKYKSRKKNKSKIDSDSLRNNSGTGVKSSLSNKGSSALSGLKNKAGNTMLNKVANAHPALKALSTINNVKNALGGRNNNNASNGGLLGRGQDNNQDNNTSNSTSSNNEENNSGANASTTEESNDNNEKKSFNPLGSLFSNSLSGKFSLFGKIPLPVKLGLMFGGPFLSLLVILVPIIAILSFFNGLFGADTALASSSGVSSIDYGDYELVSDGDEILNEALDTFLESHGTSLEEFNNLIASNVEDSGYGTRAGVVASAVTLIAELGNNYNVKIPYFWGGGHGTVSEGAEANWGSGRCFTAANGNLYTLCGLDCSGFVTWAIYNGGFNISPLTTGGFQNLSGAERVELENSAVLEPGDLLESNNHVVLVISVEESGYICAEASGRTTGVLFTSRPFDISGYWGVKMDGFYDTQARS